MDEQEIKTLIQQELPKIIQNREIRDFVLQTVTNYFAGKHETESRFDQILAELRRDREEQTRKWDEQNRKWDEQNQRWQDWQQRFDQTLADFERDRQEQARKWDEQARKWDEQNQKWDEQNQKWWENQQRQHRMEQQIDRSLEEVKKLSRKHDSTIGALGARWGLYSEQSFRNALKGILEDSFGVQVVNINEYDDQGEVFGRPEQVELDLIIKNGLLIICEIKSSMSKADMYTFERKVNFYQKRHQRQANRKMIISPMVHARAQEIALELGIEVYSYAEDVELEQLT